MKALLFLLLLIVFTINITFVYAEPLNHYGDPASQIFNNTYVDQKLQQELQKVWSQIP